MVIYFSATGNSQFVAEQIAASTGDKTFSIRNGAKTLTLAAGENLGLVVPTYFGGFPTIVREFFDAVKFDVEGENHYTYFVATCGGGYGNIQVEAADIFKKFGLPLNAAFYIFMVDNWTPYFDLTDKNYVQTAESKVEPALAAIVGKIVRRENVELPKSISDEEAANRQAAYEELRHTEKFTVSEKCVGCGKCARQCPVQAIQIQNKRPTWIKKLCTLCLGCLHACPVNAINFNHQTEGRGQYRNPRVKKIV